MSSQMFEVSIRSRNGAPSGRGCAVKSQTDLRQATNEYAVLRAVVRRFLSGRASCVFCPLLCLSFVALSASPRPDN